MQQQKSLADLKKKNAQLRKKDRRKKRAFRQKTQPILDVASSFANHQVVQTQVKQDSKTAGELFNAVHNQTAKRQANDSAEDKKNAELKMVEKQMETALLHNEQMGLYQDRAKQHRAVKTEEVLNGAAAAFKNLGKAAEGLSEAKQKALKTFTEEYINDQRKLKDLQDRLAEAEKAGDYAAAAALNGQIQQANRDMNNKLDEAERDIGEGFMGVRESLEEQKAALDNLKDAIANLDNIMKEGFGKIMKALNRALQAAYDTHPCLKEEQKIPLYWCVNQVNYCRGGESPNDWDGSLPVPCYATNDRMDFFKVQKIYHGPHFCHEGKNSKDFGEQINKKVDFSELFPLPLSILFRLLHKDSEAYRLGVNFGGWTENDLKYVFPFTKENGRADTDNRAYYMEKIKGALKVYFPKSTPECEAARKIKGDKGATAFNKLLYDALNDAFTYIIKNGCMPK
jgi:hypothetical protein